MLIAEGSLEVKLPTIWTDENDEKAELGRVREEKRRRKKIREEKKKQKTENAGARKGQIFRPDDVSSSWLKLGFRVERPTQRLHKNMENYDSVHLMIYLQ